MNRTNCTTGEQEAALGEYEEAALEARSVTYTCVPEPEQVKIIVMYVECHSESLTVTYLMDILQSAIERTPQEHREALVFRIEAPEDSESWGSFSSLPAKIYYRRTETDEDRRIEQREAQEHKARMDRIKKVEEQETLRRLKAKYETKT